MSVITISRQFGAGGKTLGEMADALPPVVMLKTKVDSDELPTGDDLAAKLATLGPGEIDSRDGLKWVGQGGWVHVRPSNTEPYLRLLIEAKDETTLAKKRSQIEGTLAPFV